MPPDHDARAPGHSVRDMLFRPFDGRLSISGPCTTPSSTIAELQTCHLGGELGDKCVKDAVLHENAIGADAGLAHVAEFGADSAFDRRVEIGVVEHDEGRVAAEFQRRPS